MNIITIPKKLANSDDLVVLPRQEYEAMMEASSRVAHVPRRQIREFTPTTAQKRALREAKKEYRRGETLSYDQLVKKLGLTN